LTNDINEGMDLGRRRRDGHGVELQHGGRATVFVQPPSPHLALIVLHQLTDPGLM